jgi:hypothetical protein
MRLVADGQAAPDLLQTRKDILTLCRVQRRDDLRRLQPFDDAELLANLVALKDDELLFRSQDRMILLLSRQLGQCIAAGGIQAWKGVFQAESSEVPMQDRFRVCDPPTIDDERHNCL